MRHWRDSDDRHRAGSIPFSTNSRAPVFSFSLTPRRPNGNTRTERALFRQTKEKGALSRLEAKEVQGTVDTWIFVVPDIPSPSYASLPCLAWVNRSSLSLGSCYKLDTMIERIFFALWTLFYVHVYLKVSLWRNILAKQRISVNLAAYNICPFSPPPTRHASIGRLSND